MVWYLQDGNCSIVGTGGLVVDKTGSYNFSYLVAGVLLIVATFLVRYMKFSR